ncbi:MAG: response regulator transcription factor [Bacteroidota bacterium]|nr:response regulator transcription factor [Ferruginibacter sp.]
MKKFLLIDDHVVVRAGLSTLLQKAFEPAEVFEAANGESALQKLAEQKFDLVILDIQMPNTDAQILLTEILRKYPGLKVLIFSMSAESVHAKRYLKFGAKGFVSKEAPLEDIIKAIKIILENRRYISEALASHLANEAFETQTDNPFNKLSAREFEIASLLLTGLTVSSIAAKFDIKVSTVGTHKARMFEKLGVSNLLELKEVANIYNL